MSDVFYHSKVISSNISSSYKAIYSMVIYCEHSRIENSVHNKRTEYSTPSLILTLVNPNGRNIESLD